MFLFFRVEQVLLRFIRRTLTVMKNHSDNSYDSDVQQRKQSHGMDAKNIFIAMLEIHIYI